MKYFEPEAFGLYNKQLCFLKRVCINIITYVTENWAIKMPTMFACNKKKLVMNKRARDSLVTRFNGNIMPYMTRTCHRSLLFRISTGLSKMSRQMEIFFGF